MRRGKHARQVSSRLRKVRGPILAGLGTAVAVSAPFLAPAAASASTFSALPADQDAPVAQPDTHVQRVGFDFGIASAQPVVSPSDYTIKPGDTLGAIAKEFCDRAGAYLNLAAANKIENPDLILAGNHVNAGVRACHHAPLVIQRPVVQSVRTSSTITQPRSRARAVTSVVSSTYGYGNVSVSGYSGYQRCVVERESGGRSQVMNSTGHYGLYQFDLGTWESGGGSAATFGRASVSEQNRVFADVYAARGTQPWSPSDGC